MLSVRSVSFAYGSTPIIRGVSFEVFAGELVVIMGPSGSGKSTLFSIITGLQAPDLGGCSFMGTAVHGITSHMFLGFQDYDAFPWYTVARNISLSRRLAVGYGVQLHEVKEIAQRVGLEDSLDKYPSELSGGMRKRLSFARCIASNAKLVILDEPFSSLDSRSRRELQLLTREVVKSTNCGVLMCTHDAHEAALLANRVVVCSGRPLSVKRIFDIEYQPPEERDPIGYERIEETAHDLLRELAYAPQTNGSAP